MKIAFVLPGGGRSGGVRSTVVCANGLIDRGHTVRILYQRVRIASADWLRNEWIGLRYPGGGESWLASFKGAASSFRDIRQCRFKVGELVIGAGLWACRELNRVNVPGIRKVHRIRGEIPWNRPFMKAAWSEKSPKIAVASYLDALVHELCGQRVYAVVPNGVSTTEYFPALDGGCRTAVGTVFGADRHKDPEIVLAVLDRLSHDCPSVPRIVFGADPRPKGLCGQSYARFPSVAEARELYGRSLVWFLGSRSEGFGNPILEAMACGCAVVATDCGGPRDIIVNGENGFLVPVGDVDRMVDRIRFLLSNSGAREQIVAKAQETVKQFTWSHSIDMLERALQSIVDGNT